MLNSLRIPLILVGMHPLLSVYSVNFSCLKVSQFISLLSNSQIYIESFLHFRITMISGSLPYISD